MTTASLDVGVDAITITGWYRYEFQPVERERGRKVVDIGACGSVKEQDDKRELVSK